MKAVTIKVFLPHGDAKLLRTAEISNWTGKAIAAPRSQFEALLEREELLKPGIYMLTGSDPNSGKPMAYIGEAEVIKDRIKSHTNKDFWIQAIVFVSKDENLTKAHIRYLEGRLIEEANALGRVKLVNSQSSGAKLPESDIADMEVFLARIYQLLPVLGSEILTPIKKVSKKNILICEIKGLKAEGMRTADGFVVFKGSQAVLNERPSAAKSPYILALRKKLLKGGLLHQKNDHLYFTRDVEFPSPSTAAASIHGGSANGLIAWKDKSGRTLKQIEND